MSDRILGDIDEIVSENVEPSNIAPRVIAHMAARGFLVIGTDGEPLDVRPALRALGLLSIMRADDCREPNVALVLHAFGITGALADACLAAAEVGS